VCYSQEEKKEDGGKEEEVAVETEKADDDQEPLSKATLDDFTNNLFTGRPWMVDHTAVASGDLWLDW